VLATVARPGAVGGGLLAPFAHRWVFDLADPAEAALLGVPNPDPAWPRSRFVDAASGLVGQLAEPPPDVPTPPRWPDHPPVPALPDLVTPAELWSEPGPPAPGAAANQLPLGFRADDLTVAFVDLAEGDHLLVAGPPRSGRTSALALVGDGILAALLDRRSTTVVAAGRADALRAEYGHWTRVVRRSRTGLLLRPDREVDGELLGAVLPRHQLEPERTGRGYLVHGGSAELVQVARWCATSAAGAPVVPARRGSRG
jgi:hypothetical protein